MNTEISYDQVADEYVRRIFDELQHKPLDRQLLDRFAASVRNAGPACDLGCGPGHVARYLRERGAQVCGLDLSPAMVERARSLNPGIAFEQGDMLALDVEDEAWVGIAAFYSLIHILSTQMRWRTISTQRGSRSRKSSRETHTRELSTRVGGPTFSLGSRRSRYDHAASAERKNRAVGHPYSDSRARALSAADAVPGSSAGLDYFARSAGWMVVKTKHHSTHKRRSGAPATFF